MQEIRKGYKYELENVESNKISQTIQFVEQEKSYDNCITTISNGTTNEEVLLMLIDRMNYLNNEIQSNEYGTVISHLNSALELLYQKTRDREKRGVEGKYIK